MNWLVMIVVFVCVVGLGVNLFAWFVCGVLCDVALLVCLSGYVFVCVCVLVCVVCVLCVMYCVMLYGLACV